MKRHASMIGRRHDAMLFLLQNVDDKTDLRKTVMPEIPFLFNQTCRYSIIWTTKIYEDKKNLTYGVKFQPVSAHNEKGLITNCLPRRSMANTNFGYVPRKINHAFSHLFTANS